MEIYFEMEEANKETKKKIILPKSIIERYSQHRNPHTLKKTNILGVVFEIDQRYEILDSSNNYSYFFNEITKLKMFHIK